LIEDEERERLLQLLEYVMQKVKRGQLAKKDITRLGCSVTMIDAVL
jgi:hypothetical protein